MNSEKLDSYLLLAATIDPAVGKPARDAIVDLVEEIKRIRFDSAPTRKVERLSGSLGLWGGET